MTLLSLLFSPIKLRSCFSHDSRPLKIPRRRLQKSVPIRAPFNPGLWHFPPSIRHCGTFTGGGFAFRSQPRCIPVRPSFGLSRRTASGIPWTVSKPLQPTPARRTPPPSPRPSPPLFPPADRLGAAQGGAGPVHPPCLQGRPHPCFAQAPPLPLPVPDPWTPGVGRRAPTGDRPPPPGLWGRCHHKNPRDSCWGTFDEHRMVASATEDRR